MQKGKVSKPRNWEEMSFGEKWVWILEKQKELEAKQDN